MYILPKILKSEIEEYHSVIPEFQAGNVNPVKFKTIRVPHGIYEQRGDNIFMLRIRCASGFVSPAQLVRVGEMAQKYGNLVHVTTRQELQIHNVLIENTAKVIDGLYEVGLATRGSGGNTVRNILGSIDSGTIVDDVFDITPYVISLTNKLIAETDSWELPRKVKIAFSSSASDSGLAAFNDIGFIAQIKDGKRGFKVYFGGGYANKPQVGEVIREFAPEEDLFAIVDAMKILFNKHGNRRNKHKARTRFLYYKYGKEQVQNFFEEEFAITKLDPKNKFFLTENVLPARTPDFDPLIVSGAQYDKWKTDNVRQQKQDGLLSVYVPFHHGNVSPEKAIKLGRFMQAFGDDTIRCSYRQNFLLRNIPKAYLGNLYHFLRELEVETDTPFFVNNLVSCTGADTCKLGICLSKGALNAVKDEMLNRSAVDFSALRDVNLNISGCPNSCGQQMVSDLGFFGKAGRNGEVYPAYNIVAGARIGENPRLATKIAEVNAHDMPRLTRAILEDYVVRKDSYTTFAEYIDAEGASKIAEIALQYKDVPTIDQDKSYYYDWGNDKQFTMVGKHAPECSAGLFDMIEVDKDIIEKSEAELESASGQIPHLLYRIVFSASRMLLVTRAIDAKTEVAVFEEFLDKFIGAGLVSKDYAELVQKAKEADLAYLSTKKDLVVALGRAVRDLYKNMDDSLQFKIDTEAVPAFVAEASACAASRPGNESVKSKDLRGVSCPINFVKTKMELATMATGEILEVLLDDGAPIENVPRSCEEEGHTILDQHQTGDGHWAVRIRKA